MPWMAVGLAVGLAGCSTLSDPCARAFDDTSSNLLQLHRDAGRARPELPDRWAWIETCQALELPDTTVACLGATYARYAPDHCAQALVGVERKPLDDAFLVIMIPEER